MRFWFAVFAVLLLATAARAGVPYEPNCSLEFGYEEPTWLCWCGTSGDTAFVRALIKDAAGDPVSSQFVWFHPDCCSPGYGGEQKMGACATLGSWTGASGYTPWMPFTEVGGSQEGNVVWEANVLGYFTFLQEGPCIRSPEMVFNCGQTPCGQVIDLIDFQYFAGCYQPNYCAKADFDSDGKVNLSDFTLFASHYRHMCDCGEQTCRIWTGERWIDEGDPDWPLF